MTQPHPWDGRGLAMDILEKDNRDSGGIFVSFVARGEGIIRENQ